MPSDVITEFLIYALLLFAPLVAYGIYYFYSSYINHKNHLDTEIGATKFRKFTIKIDFAAGIYTFMYRGKNAQNISYNKQKFEELMADDNDLKAWHTWLRKVLKNETVPNDLTVNLKQKEQGQNSLKISLVSLSDDKNTLYLQGEFIPLTDFSKISQNAALDALDYRPRINNVLKESKYPTGTVIMINFNRYEFVKRRYATTGLQKYLGAIWNYLATLDDGTTTVTGLFKLDTFLVYSKNIRTRKDVQAMVSTILSKVDSYISGTGYEIEVDPKIGYSSFGEFSTGFEMVARQAYSASVVAVDNKVDIKHYDNELDKAYQNELWLIMLLRESLKKGNFPVVNQTVVSLNEGNQIGSFIYVDFSTTKFKTFEAAYKIALDNGFGCELIECMLDLIIKKFTSDKAQNKILYTYISSPMLEQGINAYKKNKTAQGLRMALVIRDYDELIEHKDYLRVIGNVPASLQLGIVASNKMETTVHPILNSFTYVVIPEEITRDILVDDKALVAFKNIYATTSEYNLISIARDVNSYEIAEFLKENNNIFNMTGPIFGFDQSTKNYSVRRFKKLIGENEE